METIEYGFNGQTKGFAATSFPSFQNLAPLVVLFPYRTCSVAHQDAL
jgi:hypothetical protein